MASQVAFDVITAFPDYFPGPLGISLLGKAISEGLLVVRVHDLRDFTTDKHRVVDDYPYGGGAGMVMKAEPFFAAVEQVQAERQEQAGRPVVLLSPAGERFTQREASRLVECGGAILLCGHYEGVDERVAEHLVTRIISVGDYVLSGGEPAAMVVIDTCARLVPGVVGNQASLVEESWSEYGETEYPQYTRPAEFRGLRVPEVLLSGHHQKIEEWRRQQARRRAAARDRSASER